MSGVVSTDSPRGRGVRCMSPGVSRSNPRAKPKAAFTKKWIQSTCAGLKGWPAAMLNSAGPEEGQHEHDEQHEHEPDVLRQVVVDLAALLDGVDDGGEVVVGQDHPAGVLGHLGARAHGDADVGGLDRRRVVDAVAGHGDDVALLLERVDEQHLVLGRHAADDPDVVDAGQSVRVGQGGELGTEDGLAGDAQLLGDRSAGDDVVAGDHPDPDVRGLRARRPPPGTRRVGGRPSRRGWSSAARST